ncbi:hypothetical protein [Brevundimonas sp.]|uniref:hypothetical protein n=1 Tax=Brevundimonas sp. TaxID=1871086 RepID=UPI0027307CE1|nr:hypothetical protein [Brevundimonas sp.]MDP1913665.1 hypothetical protein [Brevundimonas sp.]
MPANLPRWSFSLMTIPVAIALIGYSLAIWRLWRRRPAVNMWLIGMAGHMSYFVADIVISGVGPAGAFSWDGLSSLVRVLAPGVMLLMIERDRIENPVQP